MGNFGYAIGLGVVLLIVACAVFLFMRWLQERELL
jgi:ABC-type tungstate transport system substrate-binding protein